MRDFQQGDKVCWQLDGYTYTGTVKFRSGWTIRVVPDGARAVKGNETFTRRGVRRYVLFGFKSGELRLLREELDQLQDARPEPRRQRDE